LSGRQRDARNGDKKDHKFLHDNIFNVNTTNKEKEKCCLGEYGITVRGYRSNFYSTWSYLFDIIVNFVSTVRFVTIGKGSNPKSTSITSNIEI
jgi:hypothetical protein